MSFDTETTRNRLFFGTENRMTWFPTPLTGAASSPVGMEAGGNLVNGGGYQYNSFGSHKEYTYEWGGAAAREAAQLMKSFADGTYGRGLIYFTSPLSYSTNVLPAFWADPSMGLGYEGASLVYGLDATSVPTTDWTINELPVLSAYYDLGTTAVGWRGKEQAVFVPIPTGYILSIGAFYTATGSANVFYRTQSASGGLGTATALTALANDATEIVNVDISDPEIIGVWIYVGKSSSGASSITLSGMIARLRKAGTDQSTISAGPWIGGQGHSGCRFVGKPTYIENTGVNGGQVGFAATFREVGHWLYG